MFHAITDNKVIDINRAFNTRAKSRQNKVTDKMLPVECECVSSFLTAHEHIIGYSVP